MDKTYGHDKLRSTARGKGDHVRNQTGLSSSLSWTPSRCRRLLRPLQSRIVALRRVAALEKAASEEGLCEKRDDSEIIYQPPAKKLKTADDTFEGRHKRPKRTYSRKQTFVSSAGAMESYLPFRVACRARARERQSHLTRLPEVLDVPTPILRKVRYHKAGATPTDPATCGEGERVCLWPRLEKRGRLDAALEKLDRRRHSYLPSKYQLYEGILHDLDVLLYATSSRCTSNGRKSLLSMCLRKIPHHAAEVEAWDKLNMENQGPVSSINEISYSLRVYDHLETLGGAGSGWNHLRTLLRAHAVYLLREVIVDGLLDISFIHILISYCNAIDCTLESGELIAALLTHTRPWSLYHAGRYGKDTQGDILPLCGLAEHPITTSNLFETMSSLLLHRRLSASTLSTEALDFLWTLSASSILDERASPSAVRFASTGLGLLSACSIAERNRGNSQSNSRRNPAELALMNIIGAMAAMAMVSQGFGEATDGTEMRRQSRLQRVILQILQEASQLAGNEGRKREAAYPLQLAIFVVSQRTEARRATMKVKEAVEKIWKGKSQSRRGASGADRDRCHFYDMTVALTCSISHCCGRAATRPSNHYFAEICQLIDELKAPGLATLQGDGAFLLAQKTDDLRDLVFAETLTRVSTKQGTSLRQIKTERTFFAGYRWEEGISEWVATSPAAKRQRVATQVVALSRGAPMKRDVRRNSSWNGAKSEDPSEITGAAGNSGGSQIPADAAEMLDRDQLGPSLQGRQTTSNGHQKALADGADELSMFQENQLRFVDKLGSMVIRARGERQRLVRRRNAQLGTRGRITGNSRDRDDDELRLL